MHVIRLRKPWVKSMGDRSMSCRVDVPDLVEAEDHESQAMVRYQRRFNRPAGLVGQRVYLRISGWEGRLVSLQVNGVDLSIDPTASAVHCEITSILTAHNELVLNLSATPIAAPRLTGEVTLAIESRE